MKKYKHFLIPLSGGIGFSLLFFILVVFTISCNKNKAVKKYGGTEKIDLIENEKFLNMTWKDNNMWIITIDTMTNIGYAREYSQYGIFNGVVEFKPKLSEK